MPCRVEMRGRPPFEMPLIVRICRGVSKSLSSIARMGVVHFCVHAESCSSLPPHSPAPSGPGQAKVTRSLHQPFCPAIPASRLLSVGGSRRLPPCAVIAAAWPDPSREREPSDSSPGTDAVAGPQAETRPSENASGQVRTHSVQTAGQRAPPFALCPADLGIGRRYALDTRHSNTRPASGKRRQAKQGE